jgi:hypothetical protein
MINGGLMFIFKFYFDIVYQKKHNSLASASFISIFVQMSISMSTCGIT